MTDLRWCEKRDIRFYPVPVSNVPGLHSLMIERSWDLKRIAGPFKQTKRGKEQLAEAIKDLYKKYREENDSSS